MKSIIQDNKYNNNQLVSVLLPNLKNPETIQKNIKINFNEIKSKIIEKSQVKESNNSNELNNKNKSQKENNTKKFSKGELKSIFAKNSIIVAVRIRKLNAKEANFSANETLKKISHDALLITEPIITDLNAELEKQQVLKQQKIKENHFAYDFIFDKESTQDEIYLNTGKLLVEEVLDGYNSTIFAYGATGSGKTYTMVGNGEKPGIMVRAVSDLFNLVELKKSKKCVIKVSYVEVYNENIRDLISGKNDLEVREDPKLGMQILGANEETVFNAGDVFKLLM